VKLRLRVTTLRSGARINPMDPRLLVALRAAELAVDEALWQSRDDRDQREALWGEWAELRRKLRIYQARTLPMWAEDVEFAGLYDIARNRLWHDPCDLGAAGIAVENYAEAIVVDSGSCERKILSDAVRRIRLWRCYRIRVLRLLRPATGGPCDPHCLRWPECWQLLSSTRQRRESSRLSAPTTFQEWSSAACRRLRKCLRTVRLSWTP